VNAFTIGDFRVAMRRGPYAWPGGYPCYFITSDGAALSFAVARENCGAILRAIHGRSGDGWRVIGVAINWEDPELFCDHSGARIPSAYADTD